VKQPSQPLDPDVSEPPVEDDTTLGGYFKVHKRPPAFEGCDGHPYTVSLETERLPDLRDPIGAFLVFPRWAENGLGIIGHVETDLKWRGSTETDAKGLLEALPLADVQTLLNHAILERAGVVMDPTPTHRSGAPETVDGVEPEDEPSP